MAGTGVDTAFAAMDGSADPLSGYMTKKDFDAWAAKQQPLRQDQAAPNLTTYNPSYDQQPQPQQQQMFRPLGGWSQQPSYGQQFGYGGPQFGMMDQYSGGYGGGYGRRYGGFGGYGGGFGGYGQQMYSPYGGMGSGFGMGGMGGYGMQTPFSYGQQMGYGQQQMGYGGYQQPMYGGFQPPMASYQQPTQNFSQAGFGGK